jgi:hypothetical protein
MAEKKEVGVIRKFLSDFDLWDIAAALTGGWLGSRKRTAEESGNSVVSIAPKQEDESNLDCLLTVLEEGGYKGIICAEQITGIHQALVNIHTDYAYQFRNYFFSMRGIKAEEMFDQLQKILGSLVIESDDNSWAILTKSSSFPIKRALKLCREIQAKVDQSDPYILSYEEAVKQAYVVIARRMIDERRLPGTLTSQTEERLLKASDTINNYLQGKTRERDESNEADHKKTLGFFGWIKIIAIIAMVVWFLFEIYTASTTQVPKNDAVNPTGALEDKISRKIDGAYQFITKEK